MQRSTALKASSALPREADARSAAVDVRDVLFAPLEGRTYAFTVTASEHAVLAGSRALATKAAEIELDVEWLAAEGERLEPGAPVCRARGDAWHVVRAEEVLMGAIGKPSGVATAAAHLVALAGGRARVVCGAWKKVTAEVQAELRNAVTVGGAGTRILDRPFVYLDKNYVRMLGGAGPAVRQARRVDGRAIVVQLRGELAGVAEEAESAVAEGADLLMVDTGQVADLAAVRARVASGPGASRVVLAFGGGVRADDVSTAIDAGATVLDVGRAILDAPLVDFRLDVR